MVDFNQKLKEYQAIKDKEKVKRMPFKVSSAPEDAFHMGGKFADGWGVITDARAIVFQYAPTTDEGSKKTGRPVGSQDPPSLQCEITIQRYQDGDGNKAPSPPETKMLGMQKPTQTAEGPVLELTPGDYVDGNLDTDPVDKGGDLGAEGNTVVAQREGYQFNDKCGWMTFATSLQEAGFKPTILKRTYFPDLIGLYAYFQTVTLPKFRDNMTNDPTAFIVQKGSIKSYPYEKPAGGKVTASKKGTNAAAKVNNVPAHEPAQIPGAREAAAEIAGVTPEDFALAVVRDVCGKKKGQIAASANKLKLEFLMGVNAIKPPVPSASKKAVIDQIQDESWLMAVGMMHGLFNESEDGSGKYTFAG